MSALDDLVAVVARLRSPDGCPWDRAQTWASMRPYVLEEAYEVLSAIDGAQGDDLAKELGDMLFQIVLLSRIAEDDGLFDIERVARSITDKMIRRHPHVFDPSHERSASDVGIAAWEARKAKERTGSALDGVPEALPALLRAHRVSEKASRVGFDWPDAPSVRRKVDEELRELDEAMASGDASAIGEELGDLLFALVNLGRHLPVTAEDALRGATSKFERRFRRVEELLVAEGRSVHEASAEELEACWAVAKKDLS